VRGVERLVLLGHLGLAVLGSDLEDQLTLAGLAGDDGGLPAVAGGEQPFEFGHDVAAAVLGGLVTALAAGLGDGPDLLVVTDRWVGGGSRRFLGRGGGRSSGEEDQGEESSAQRPQRWHVDSLRPVSEVEGSCVAWSRRLGGQADVRAVGSGWWS